MSSKPKYDLIKWETPFSEAILPAVWIIGNEDDEDEESNLIAAVAPEGLDNYPKYLIRFSDVFAYKCEEEAQWVDEYYESDLSKDPESKCSCLRPSGSYWWDAYEFYMKEFFDVEPMHFYLFGGDNNVQVFASKEFEIEEVKESKVLNLKYVV